MSRSSFLTEFLQFLNLWLKYFAVRVKRVFFGFESVKCSFVELLYRQRGKFARPFVHSGMVALSAMGIMLVPIVSQEFPVGGEISGLSPSAVLSAATENEGTGTITNDRRIEITEYTIGVGDTISTVAQKFGISEDTILWENDLTKKTVLKPGQVLKILPETGVSHKVSKGETIYSIAKKYGVFPQPIVNYPSNTFVNDETFSLAVGQVLIIPDGTPPAEAPAEPRYLARKTPDAGSGVGLGNFVWPAGGHISQGFKWYHRGLDIANRGAPDVLAADSGTVTISGWPDNTGYGLRVLVDHGNGMTTMYAHLQKVYVTVGQRVARGNAIGQMGSTGRSTGTHLHFEIRRNGAAVDPTEYLR